jgi:dipeptidase E
MTRPQRQIIALGGGSFTVDLDNPALDRYIIAQSGKRHPKVCFIGTATGDSAAYIAKFYAAYTRLGCRATHLPFFERTPDLKKLILAQDVIYVGGGNTKSMLAVWRDWQLPQILRRAWSAGTVLAGVSAGAICWFDTGITDSWAGHLAPLPCLGWLPKGCCPHYDGEKERKPAVHEFVARGAAPEILALDDGAAAHFIGRKLLRVVASREQAGAYRVKKSGRISIEMALPVTRLERARYDD